jgi:hypothetical protein
MSKSPLRRNSIFNEKPQKIVWDKTKEKAVEEDDPLSTDNDYMDDTFRDFETETGIDFGNKHKPW